MDLTARDIVQCLVDEATDTEMYRNGLPRKYEEAKKCRDEVKEVVIDIVQDWFEVLGNTTKGKMIRKQIEKIFNG